MCGIAGVLNLTGEPVSQRLLQSMGEAIAHRGPDGHGVYVDGHLGFAHRRLAIIDLSPAGHQPMATQDGRYVITYNGEVYNYQSLRVELESLGCQFHSDTDTEVVLQAYATWGAKAVDRFNGMFAFAIWDKEQHSLFLARDRYGIKPLYYYQDYQHFIFGSEVKAIQAHPNFQAKMDQEALVEYFTFQNFFTDKTLFAGVNMFPAGHHGKISLKAKPELLTEQYWDYHFKEPEHIQDEQAYIEELDRLFKQAVYRQLISDVEVGSYLSGGMDSGSITAIAGSNIPGMKTFTVGFDLHSASGIELGFDEREKAEYMSYLFGTEHYQMVLKAGDMERSLKKLCYHLEEPRVGQSYPNYYAAQLASRFCKVVLAGSGGDELFAGYPWRYYRATNCTDFESYIDNYYRYWQRLMDNKELWQAFSPIKSNVEHVWTRNIFKDVFPDYFFDFNEPADGINRSLYFEAKTFLHGLLAVEDKLSMAHSLETRVPFLDNDLVDFAMKVPVNFKLKNLQEVIRLNENQSGDKGQEYFKKTNDGKVILRKALSKYIPDKISKAVKQGFSSPDDSWFKGESLEFVKRELVDAKHAPIYDYLDKQYISSLVEQHLSGQRNRRLLIWSLLNVNQWCKTFL